MKYTILFSIIFAVLLRAQEIDLDAGARMNLNPKAYSIDTYFVEGNYGMNYQYGQTEDLVNNIGIIK